MTVPAVLANADRIAQAVDVAADGADVIREVLVGQLCGVQTQEGSYADRCTGPMDRVVRVPVGVDEWPNARTLDPS